MQKDLGYLTAKLEEMHSDIKDLKEKIDILRHESTGRKAVHRVLIGGLGFLTTVVGWLVHTIIP